MTPANKVHWEASTMKKTGIDNGKTIDKILKLVNEMSGEYLGVELRIEHTNKHKESIINLGSVIAVMKECKKEKLELLQSEERLSRALHEKTILVHEVQHRVRNNLQLISSLLYLQLDEIKDEIAREKYIENHSRIASMALIHENLYQSSDFQRIDFGTYLNSLSDHLFHTCNMKEAGISLEINVDNVQLDIEKAVPCGLIAHELITNSIKHAFPDKVNGIIKVQLLREHDTYQLEVSDNGVGLDKDMDSYHTLGLKLINILTNQIKGTLIVSGQNGTNCSITFNK